MTPSREAVRAVIVHYGPPEATVRAVRWVRAAGWPVTVVDNDGGLDLDDDPLLRVLRPGANLGFGRAVNLAARDIDARWLFLLNPDTDADPAGVEKILEVADQGDHIGVLAPTLLYPDGSPQINGGRYDGWVHEAARISRTGHRVRRLRAAVRREYAGERRGRARTLERNWVSGAAMLVRREAFDAVGGFDERFFLYFEDEDLCRRLRAQGWRIAVTPEAQVRHVVHGATGGPRVPAPRGYQESRALYHRIHSGPLLRRVVAWESARRLESSAT